MQYIYQHISPVYSAYHPEASIGSMRLLKHQVETEEAFHDPAIDVIFNTAMTGDGKSLAAYLPALQAMKTVLAMYPTNELIHDQHRALLTKYAKNVHFPLPSNNSMDGAKVSRMMREHDETKRFEEVRKFLVRNAILLTNPDLVHLMLSHQYGWQHQRKELAVTLGAYFDYFIFDEFHIFGAPQVVAVMNMLGYLLTNYRAKLNERKKFLFLSATPSPLLTTMLDDGGIRYKVIQGCYASAPQVDYRCILQACDLRVHEISRDASTEDWVREHVDEIRLFFEQHNGSKAAILVYSVATARRLVTFLKDALEKPYGLQIGENTGLTHRADRQDAYDKDILVGTSTVDIGVDFHINYLIFEASNAGSFLQRFGRLGRHAEFTTYQAHALVPRFVLERLQKLLETGQEIARDQFNEHIREVFPIEQEFAGYKRRWGVVQAAQVLAELQGQKKRDANEAFTLALHAQYERLYGATGKPVMPKALAKYWGYHHNAPEMLAELSSFRGQSPLSCAIWDTDAQLKTYDLFFLLANTRFEVLTKEAFLQEVQQRGLDEREFRQKHFYLRVWDYLPATLTLALGLRHNLAENAQYLNQALVLNDFFVRDPPIVGLDKINRSLKTLKLPCLISPTPRDELRQRFKLGGIFPLYHLRDGWGRDYSVAFGQEALLLDSLLFFRKTADDRPMML